MGELLSELHVQEGILYPIPYRERTILAKLKPIVMWIAAIIVLLSLIFQHNIFMDFEAHTRAILILIFIRMLFVDVDRWGPSDMDILFYDDRIEIFRPKVYRGKNNTLQEYVVMYYKDIKEGRYRKVSGKIEIYGLRHGEYKEYKKDGTLKDGFVYNKTLNSAIIFYVRFMDVEMVISELEKYLRITIEERDS